MGEVVTDVVDNRGKNPSYYCDEGIPIIDNFMIKNALYPDLKTAIRFIDNNLYTNFIRKYNKLNDVIMTLVGNGIGNISLFPKEKSVIIQNTLGFRFTEEQIFMFFMLMSKNDEIIKLDRGMAQPSIRQDEILALNINIPQKKEQTAIGNLFKTLDNIITCHQRN